MERKNHAWNQWATGQHKCQALHCPRKRGNSTSTLGLALGSPLGLGVVLKNAPVIAFGGLLLLGWFVFLIWDYHFKTNSFCTVVFKFRKEALGFWKRNKDQAVLMLLSAVIGAVIGGGITLLVTLIKG